MQKNHLTISTWYKQELIASSIQNHMTGYCTTRGGIITKWHNSDQLQISMASKIFMINNYCVSNHITFTISCSVRQQQLTYPPCVSHTFSSALLSWCRNLLRCPPETSQPASFNEDDHQCQSVGHSLLSSNPLPDALSALSVCLHLRILTSRVLSCSLSLCVGFIHWRGCVPRCQHCTIVDAHVCGCVSVSMCGCRKKCRLPPMRHIHRHTCTHRGGGCCVRTEGAVGVLSELDLVFLSYFTEW